MAKVTPGICLSGRSALEYWRASVRPPSAHEWVDNPTEALREPPRVAYLDEMDNRWQQALHAPLDISVASFDARRKLPLSLARVHLCKAGLPLSSAARAGRGLYVLSPEICFMQAAESLSLPELVFLGLELCGTYAPPRPGTAGLVQRTTPLTSTDVLERTLAQLPNVRNRARATRALRLVADGAASPMESMATVLLSMPRRYGGFGLPTPLLNQRIDFDDTTRDIARRSYAVADLFWPHARIDVEYEGRAYHESPASMASDKARANALAHMGIRTISLFSEHIQYDHALYPMAQEIARALGVRMGPHEQDSQSRERRLALRRSLLRHAEGSAEPRWPGLREGEPTLAEALEEHHDRDGRGKRAASRGRNKRRS